MKLFGYKIQMRPVKRAIQVQRDAGQRMIRRARSGASRAMKAVGSAVARINEVTAYEVRPSHDGWMVTRAGSSLPMRVFTKKPDAVKEARKLARAKKTHVDVFTRQGSLQTRQSFA